MTQSHSAARNVHNSIDIPYRFESRCSVLMAQVPQGVQLQAHFPQETRAVVAMSKGVLPGDCQETSESTNSRLNLTGAAIRMVKERSRNGASLLAPEHFSLFTDLCEPKRRFRGAYNLIYKELSG